MERKTVVTFTEYGPDYGAPKAITYCRKGLGILPEKIVFVLSILLLFSFNVFSQSKYEKEFRIDPKDVPYPALTFVDSLTFDSRVKWYKEIGLELNTIEAKAKIKRVRHSIEFCEEGIFQDTEIEVKPDKIQIGRAHV